MSIYWKQKNFLLFGFISNQFRFRKQIDNQIVRVLKYPLIDAFYMVVQIEKKKTVRCFTTIFTSTKTPDYLSKIFIE